MFGSFCIRSNTSNANIFGTNKRKRMKFGDLSHFVKKKIKVYVNRQYFKIIRCHSPCSGTFESVNFNKLYLLVNFNGVDWKRKGIFSSFLYILCRPDLSDVVTRNRLAVKKPRRRNLFRASNPIKPLKDAFDLPTILRYKNFRFLVTGSRIQKHPSSTFFAFFTRKW